MAKCHDLKATRLDAGVGNWGRRMDRDMNVGGHQQQRSYSAAIKRGKDS
jgi:hypothetical protein